MTMSARRALTMLVALVIAVAASIVVASPAQATTPAAVGTPSFTGRVVEADHADQGVYGSVFVEDTTGAVRQVANSDTDGNFTAYVQPGQYYVHFAPGQNWTSDSGYADQWWPGTDRAHATLLTLEDGDVIPNIDATVARLGSVSGLSVLAGGVSNAGQITLRNVDTGMSESIYGGASTSGAPFRFGAVPVGRYQLFYQPNEPGQVISGWYKNAYTEADATTFSVALGQDVTGIDVHSQNLAGAFGTFADFYGKPLDGQVILYDLNRNIVQIVYATSGFWSMRGIPEGQYKIQAISNVLNGESRPTAVWYNAGGAGTFDSADTVTIAYNATNNFLIRLNSLPLAQQSAYVTALYVDYLNRTPSASETWGWIEQLQLGAPRRAISDGFVNSDEYRLIRIDNAYQSILGRAADAPGRAGWLKAMKAGYITTDDIETQFYASQEFYLSHGGTDKQYAAALYQTLLKRNGSQSDYAFWANLIMSHGRDWVISQFWDAPETISARVSAMYQKYLGRVPDTGGLNGWVSIALKIGDSGLRSGLTGSDEYYARAYQRYNV